MPGLHVSFGEYIQQHLKLTQEESDALRRRYWQRYGATLLGLVKHHGGGRRRTSCTTRTCCRGWRRRCAAMRTTSPRCGGCAGASSS